MTVETKDAPGQVGTTSTQLSNMIETALANALNERAAAANIQLVPTGSDQDHGSAAMAQEPQNDILKAIHSWTLKDDATAPKEGQVIVMNQDRVEVLDNGEFEQRLATMNQPALAGTVNTLNGIGGLDIPWGNILLGALPGAIVSEVVDGLMPAFNPDGSLNFQNVAIKLGIAWAGVQFGPQLVGRQASQFFAGGIIIFVLADILPLDQWVATIRGWFQRNGATSGQDLSQHELSLARQHQGSQASQLDPSQGSDALETLRGLQARRAAA